MIGGTIETGGPLGPAPIVGRRVGRAAPPLAVRGTEARPRRHGRDGGLPLQRPPAELSGHAVAVREPQVRRRAHGPRRDARLPELGADRRLGADHRLHRRPRDDDAFKQDPAKEAGNVGGDLFRRYSDPAERETKLISELKNGRLAMMGIMGMLVTDPARGHGPIWRRSRTTPFGVVGSKLTFCEFGVVVGEDHGPWSPTSATSGARRVCASSPWLCRRVAVWFCTKTSSHLQQTQANKC